MICWRKWRGVFAAGCALWSAVILTSASLAQAADPSYPVNRLENFRIESTEKLNDLYTVRNMYVDSNNANATEGVQLFISEIRKAVYLTSNVLDIAFFYNLHKKYDDKNVLKEYVYSRIGEINDSMEYTVKTLEGLSDALRTRGQGTLAKDFSEYANKVVEMHSVIRDLQDSVDSPKKNAPPAGDKKAGKPALDKKTP
jgi:hypothetical protein